MGVGGEGGWLGRPLLWDPYGVTVCADIGDRYNYNITDLIHSCLSALLYIS